MDTKTTNEISKIYSIENLMSMTRFDYFLDVKIEQSEIKSYEDFTARILDIIKKHEDQGDLGLFFSDRLKQHISTGMFLEGDERHKWFFVMLNFHQGKTVDDKVQHMVRAVDKHASYYHKLNLDLKMPKMPPSTSHTIVREDGSKHKLMARPVPKKYNSTNLLDINHIRQIACVAFQKTRAGLMPVRLTNRGLEIYLVQFKDCDIWGLPAGWVEEGESLWNGALREFNEETNSELEGHPGTLVVANNFNCFITWNTPVHDKTFEGEETAGAKWTSLYSILHNEVKVRDATVSTLTEIINIVLRGIVPNANQYVCS
jgi:8-oxo-dGTP pyrophosphatase MutT (NUDIX family)